MMSIWIYWVRIEDHGYCLLDALGLVIWFSWYVFGTELEKPDGIWKNSETFYGFEFNFGSLWASTCDELQRYGLFSLDVMFVFVFVVVFYPRVLKGQCYTVLREVDIKRLQEDDITKVSTVLSISRVDASILLRHYNWSVSKVHDAWFANEDAVRKSVGLLDKPVVEFSNTKELTCGICFDSYSRDKVMSAACGHPFCSACWRGYISATVNDGPGCLMLRCPDPSCRAAVGEDMIYMLASDEDKEKYSHYLLRSYVEDNRKTKWCPAPGCEYAVDFAAGSGNFDVSCLCSYNFCWNCTEEAHRPVDCCTVAKWILKNRAESENMNWILANSKPCPKCKRPIEKNQGCMHMTCTPPCKFEFCWLCLGAWSDHGERTGGFYACNRYETAKQQGDYDDAERRREMAKNSLEKYTHYYERWASNQSSRQKALADLHQMQTVHLQKLSDIHCTPESQAQVHCRCVASDS